MGSFFRHERPTFLFICSVWPKHTANFRTPSKIIKPTSRTLKTTKDPHFGYLGVFNLDFFRHSETVQNCHFSSDIRFSQNISTNIFFNTIRNLNVISGVKRYIRIFDVISEVYSVSLRRRRRFENKCSHLSQPLCPNFWSVFPARKTSFGWNFFVSFS